MLFWKEGGHVLRSCDSKHHNSCQNLCVGSVYPSWIGRYTRKIAEAEQLKRELVDKLSATTVRHSTVLQWAGKSTQDAASSS